MWCRNTLLSLRKIVCEYGPRALHCIKTHLIFFEPVLEVDEEDPVGVDGAKDDSVAEEAAEHHQPGLGRGWIIIISHFCNFVMYHICDPQTPVVNLKKLHSLI